jgi:dihydroorotate dehydrogenase
MFTLSNGHEMEYVVASGGAAFNGRYWLWEKPLVWLGLVDPSLFTIILKTITLKPRAGNLRWWKPWECVRLIKDGAVNKVGLTNPGLDYWMEFHWPQCRGSFIISLSGNKDELVSMILALQEYYDLNDPSGRMEDLTSSLYRSEDFYEKLEQPVAIQINGSCPNSSMLTTEELIEVARAAKQKTDWPLIVKGSANQDYVKLAKELVGVVEAFDINSVPWETVYPGKQSPLHQLEQRVKGGGGGVSGKAAQAYTWKAVEELAREVPEMPVIGPSIWEFEDLDRLRKLGAKALSFGAIHLARPWAPTAFVRRELKAAEKSLATKQ